MNQELKNKCINLSKEKLADKTKMIDEFIKKNSWKFPHKMVRIKKV